MSALIQPRESRTVEDLLKAGQLTRVVADISLATGILDAARGRLRSVSRALDAEDLGECSSPLWDAARLACTAVLQAEGLRTHGEGHHATVIEAVTEQYGHLLGGLLRPARRLRETRREAQYPTRLDTMRPNAADLAEDLDTITQLVDAVAKLLPHVPVY